MLFAYFILAVALLIETVGAYYSITGLAAIFSGAVVPILIMGGSLELGKVTAAVWLKNNWERASLQFKLYLLPAVVMLMLITSMGIFGFLSKAHSDQSLVSGDVTSKIAVYDEKIKTAKENIDANRKALKQLDEAVDQVMGRSQDEKGADKAVALRRGQAKERTRLLSEITAEQKTIAQLSEERAPIAAEVRKVEADVGPIKYIAKLIYNDNPDANILEKAVTWVIMTIVAVFDPLALVLILAAQQSIRWANEDKNKTADENNINQSETPNYPPDDGPLTEEQIKQIKESVDPHPPGWMFEDDVKSVEPVAEEVAAVDCVKCGAPLENLPGIGLYCTNKDCKDLEPEEPEEPEEQIDTKLVPTTVVVNEYEGQIPPETAIPYKEVQAEVPEFKPSNKQLGFAPMPDNVENIGNPINSGFGTSFPPKPEKGDMFLRVDFLPSRLFKWNEKQWIEIDKELTDSYTYDDSYIEHLIAKVDAGEYDVEMLNDSERAQIQEYLTKKVNNG